MALIDRSTLETEVEAARSRGLDQDVKALLKWSYELLGERLMMSTAFGKSGMVLIHMARELMPELPIYFLDTGFHFQETLDYADRIRREWGINIINYRPKLFGATFKAAYGENLYQSNPDLCCHKNKVEPFEEILERYQGWITAIRRDQSSTRAQAEPLELLENGKLKVQPLVLWPAERIDGYLEEHRIPLHPLMAQGYGSIGCAPCTKPGKGREGRWDGKKKECGLHFIGLSANNLAARANGKKEEPGESPQAAPQPAPPAISA